MQFNYLVFIDVLGKILAIYAVVLIVASLVLNPLVIFVCLKSKTLRSTSTFKLLVVSAINDLLVSLVWNQDNFSITFFSVSFAYSSPFYCRWLSLFLQYTTLQIESWLLVSISMDRLLSLTWKNWSTLYFRKNRPFIFAACLVTFNILIHINEGFTVGYFEQVNGTESFFCYGNAPGTFQWYVLMSQILVYFGELLPFGLLIVFNLLIIYKANRFERVQKASSVVSNSLSGSSKRKRQMTRMILFITFLYIVVTTPSTIISGYFYPKIIVLLEGQLIINVINGLQFSFPAFNFFILFFSNRLFAREAKSLVFRTTDVQNTSQTNESRRSLNRQSGSYN